jgi:hypothetical protein
VIPRGAILTVLFLVPTGIGLALGTALRNSLKASQWDQRSHLPIWLFLLLPAAVHAAERWANLAKPVESLASSREGGWPAFEVVQRTPPRGRDRG